MIPPALRPQPRMEQMAQFNLRQIAHPMTTRMFGTLPSNPQNVAIFSVAIGKLPYKCPKPNARLLIQQALGLQRRLSSRPTAKTIIPATHGPPALMPPFAQQLILQMLPLGHFQLTLVRPL